MTNHWAVTHLRPSKVSLKLACLTELLHLSAWVDDLCTSDQYTSPQAQAELNEAKRLFSTGGWHDVSYRGSCDVVVEVSPKKTSHHTKSGAYTWHIINSGKMLSFQVLFPK